MPYDIILVKFRPKDTQILESDFGKPQNWKTFCYIAISNFQDLFLMKFNSKSSSFEKNLSIIISVKVARTAVIFCIVYLICQFR